MKKILVIEDGPRHIDDAKAYFADKPVEVLYAQTFKDALGAMNHCGEHEHRPKDDVDGVISDVYFPLREDSPWNEAEALGVGIAILLEKAKIPFVLNTAGYHHGPKIQWVYDLCKINRWDLVDVYNSETRDYLRPAEAQTKDWDRAFKKLEEIMAER
jgi:hypothetical protein